jgi:bifunctional DNA-binding transcriptional regulator/antitoxin component of YhaV-PrlF toxin-antitoxin module
MKLQELNKMSYFVVLPKQIVMAKGWKKGDNIKAEINKEGNIVLKKGEQKLKGEIL